MQLDTFWNLIHDADGVPGSPEHVENIGRSLAQLPAEAIIGFETRRQELFARAYSNRLWGAAYLINGGCSDDGFEYFQGWLVLQGREVFEAALTDPDSLANHEGTEEDVEAEDFLYTAAKAYEDLTGQDIYSALPGERPPRDLGDDWDFDNDEEMKHRYPKLFALFSLTPPPPPRTKGGSRFWLLATLLSGLLLLSSIIIGLWTSLNRAGRTMELLDDPGTSSSDLSRGIEESIETTRLSLYLGLPVAAFYLLALYMYRKSKRNPTDT